MIRRTDDPAENLADEIYQKLRSDSPTHSWLLAAIHRYYPPAKAKRPKKMSRKKMDNPYRGVFDFTSIG